MNKHQVKGTIDDVAGRMKRQAGEWTGDTKVQLEGLGQQVKGKAETALGTAKEAVHDGQDQLKGQGKKAWEMVQDSASEAKEEAERRRQAQQMKDGGDLDPVHQSGGEVEKTHSYQR
jgi:uncharacterized protein YjbJ (UPF0337 family)